MKRTTDFYPVFCLVVITLVAGCEEYDAALSNGAGRAAGADAGMDSDWGPGQGPSAAGTGGQSGYMDAGTADGEGVPPPLQPEEEKQVEFELPKAGENYVFAANPGNNSVAVINATTYGVTTMPVGERPTFLQTIAGTDTAIVLDVQTDNAFVLRAYSDDDIRGSKEAVPVVQGANAIEVSADEEHRHAVVYRNYALSTTSATSGNRQIVTVITLSEEGDQSQDFRVGFRPTGVFFTQDGSRGFVITEEGVSILDFAEIDQNKEVIPRTVELGYTPDEIPSDVSVTPDGHYALARLQNASVVHLVDLDTGQIQALDLVLGEIVEPGGDADSDADSDGTGTDAGTDGPTEPDVVTDIDLSPDGSFAVAVLRSQSKVLRIPVPDAFSEPSQIDSIELEGVIIGSVTIAEDSRQALLYTTADPVALTPAEQLQLMERITILDLEGDKEHKTVRLEKAIAAVAISPDSKAAFIVHKRQQFSAETPGSEDELIDRSFGYSLLKLDTGSPMLQTSQAPVGRFAIVPDGSYLFILFREDGLNIRELHHVSLTQLLPNVIPLLRPPISVGLVPQVSKVFVSQEHPDGLITFFDWATAKSQAVTGFERNSRIDEF